uniref:Uncharacterized protein n=1 Tax=Melopsittacus undulatus TaxID=13146 RepID=A0A8V5GME1_MELUD
MDGAGPDARARFRVARFIMEAGVKLGLGSVAVCTACSAFHRCCRALRMRRRHDPHLVAAAAIALAAKAEGTPLRTRDLLNVTHRCLHPGVPPLALDAEFWALRDSLMQCELWVLRVLRFRLPLAQEHKYLAQFSLALGQWARGGRGGAPAVAWALLRDGAAGGLGLRSPPQHVAAAALHLAMELCGCGAPPGAPPRWWQVRGGGGWGGGMGGGGGMGCWGGMGGRDGGWGGMGVLGGDGGEGAWGQWVQGGMGGWGGWARGRLGAGGGMGAGGMG